jgi:hypothetical protein
MPLAEREFAAFFDAMKKLFGPQQARLANLTRKKDLTEPEQFGQERPPVEASQYNQSRFSSSNCSLMLVCPTWR